MKYKLLLLLFQIVFIIESSSSASNIIIKTTKSVYYGYISENIRVIDSNSSNVFIRFIDQQKPEIIDCKEDKKYLFRILNGNEDDYFQEPFKMDSSCFIQLKLKSNREQLNREAIDIYNLNISITSGSSRSDDYYFQIIIQIIDDNDNDPLFDKYEYQFDINDLTYLSP